MRERLARLGQAMRVPDIRKRIVFLMAMFAVYVGCAHIPLPGMDKAALETMFQATGGIGQLLDAQRAALGDPPLQSHNRE